MTTAQTVVPSRQFQTVVPPQKLRLSYHDNSSGCRTITTIQTVVPPQKLRLSYHDNSSGLSVPSQQLRLSILSQQLTLSYHDNGSDCRTMITGYSVSSRSGHETPTQTASYGQTNTPCKTFGAPGKIKLKSAMLIAGG
eukprot:jgi/Botrbrau1/4558/Bobra.60_2s0045.1